MIKTRFAHMPNVMIRFSFSTVVLLALLIFSITFTPSSSQAQEFGSNWTATYYSDANFTTPVVSVPVSQINFNIPGAPPGTPITAQDGWSLRINGVQTFQQGTYRFFLTAGVGDTAIVTIDGVEVFNITGTGAEITQDFLVTAASTPTVELRYVDNTGAAVIRLYWQSVDLVPTPTAGPSPTPTATGLPPIPPGAITATVIRAAVLNVRQAPSLGAPVIGQILRGQTYAIVGRDPDAYWFLLQLGGYQGWAYGYYLFVDGNEFTPPIASAGTAFGFPPGVQDTGVIVQVRAGMKMRTQPNLQAEQNGRIPWGSFLPVVGRNSLGDWYQVVWKGTVGWVFSGYSRVFQGDLANVPIVPGT